MLQLYCGWSPLVTATIPQGASEETTNPSQSKLEKTINFTNQEYYRRTAITRPDELSHKDHELIYSTLQEWLDGCNIESNLAWENKHTQKDVRNIAKDTVEEETELGSQHSILSCHEVASSIQSCIERRKNGEKATQPHFTSKSITYDRRTLTVFPDKEQVSLTVLGDHSRVRADLALPSNDDG